MANPVGCPVSTPMPKPFMKHLNRVIVSLLLSGLADKSLAVMPEVAPVAEGSRRRFVHAG